VERKFWAGLGKDKEFAGSEGSGRKGAVKLCRGRKSPLKNYNVQRKQGGRQNVASREKGSGTVQERQNQAGMKVAKKIKSKFNYDDALLGKDRRKGFRSQCRKVQVFSRWTRQVIDGQRRKGSTLGIQGEAKHSEKQVKKNHRGTKKIHTGKESPPTMK